MLLSLSLAAAASVSLVPLPRRAHTYARSLLLSSVVCAILLVYKYYFTIIFGSIRRGIPEVL